MTDGTGATTYGYAPIGSLGALQLQQESGPLANSAIAYTYDALGRPASRIVAGGGAETLGYDPIGRLTSHTSDLGAFTLGYLGQTSQVTQRQLANTTLATAWSYLPNSGDRRLAGISNIGLTAGQLSTYGYSTTPENFISAISETSDSVAVYPSTLTQTASYNNLNQLTNLSGQSLTFDGNGNLLSDGQRNYSWDAENRLIGITYPGQSGKRTVFAYDGLSRRIAITSTPAGGSATSTSYLWCGTNICQARNASNNPTRGYYTEGEFVPGSPGQPYYYGPDQIGSVRRVFASTTSAPAYGYDPYGRALQSTAPLTDFNYAGTFYNADGGLYLTRYRAYDPVAGRWLTRDPLGETAGNATGSATRIPDSLSAQRANYGHDAYRYTVASTANYDDPRHTVSSGNDTLGIDSLALAQVHFLSEDPGQFMEGANLYAYVLGNPVQFTDQLGLATFCQKVRAICLAVMCYVTGETPPRIEITPPTGPGHYGIKRSEKMTTKLCRSINRQLDDRS